jgi:hypothetical protein
MPCPWLCKELELRRADETSTTYVDTTGSISAICGQTPEDGSFIAIETKLFEQYLKNNDYECLWIFLAERNAFKHGGMLGGGSHLRVEGVAWKQGHNIVKEVWKK